MPKSKKPRRKYHPNPREKIIWYSPLDAIDNFVDMFTNIELVCETKLPRGNRKPGGKRGETYWMVFFKS